MVIGISGKAGSGKNLVGSIIEYLTSTNGQQKGTFEECQDYGFIYDTTFELKLFADKLKDIVCLLIGCTREQLEDREFKEKELGEEWKIWEVFEGVGKRPTIIGTEEDAKKLCIEIWGEFIEPYAKTKILTPRKLLQLLGTDCGRDIIHPNIWVNALMSNYKTSTFMLDNGVQARGVKFPDWIITDVRFPNELKAIEDRKGITIRVNTNRAGILSSHLSETSLDNAKFDYIIDNSGTIEELVEKVREILIKENII